MSTSFTLFKHTPDPGLGVGTRDYYRRLGYWLDGPYMVKDLLYDD